MTSALRIGHKTIGPGAPVFIIAEAGVNHNTREELALQLVEEAAKAGADAIKFQTYDARKLVTRTAPKYYVDTMAQWLRHERPTGFQADEFSQLDSLSKNSYRAIKRHCDKLKIMFLSTPFDEVSVDLLEDLGVAAYKIASGDITDLPLLRYTAKKRKPILLSTGCSTLGDIERALDAILEVSNVPVALMHCTLSYPTAAQDVNLNMMKTMINAFPTRPVGLSDHSLGTTASIAATALGARLLEKHFTIDKTMGVSTDHFMSVDPQELKQLVQGVRDVEAMMGKSEKHSVPAEELARQYARRSLVLNIPVKKGAVIKKDNILIKRPGTGLEPRLKDVVTGRRAARDIDEDIVLTWDMIQ